MESLEAIIMNLEICSLLVLTAFFPNEYLQVTHYIYSDADLFIINFGLCKLSNNFIIF